MRSDMCEFGDESSGANKQAVSLTKLLGFVISAALIVAVLVAVGRNMGNPMGTALHREAVEKAGPELAESLMNAVHVNGDADVDYGLVTVKEVTSGYYLSAINGGNDKKMKIETGVTSSSKWYLQFKSDSDGGYYQLKSKSESNKCLKMASGGTVFVDACSATNAKVQLLRFEDGETNSPLTAYSGNTFAIYGYTSAKKFINVKGYNAGQVKGESDFRQTGVFAISSTS